MAHNWHRYFGWFKGASVKATTAVFGDPTNNTTFSATGTLTQNGSASTWDDVYPSSVTVGPGSSAPQFTVYNGGNLRAYEFLGTGATTKDLNIGFQFPHSQKITGTITLSPHVHLFIPADASIPVGETRAIKMYCNYTWTAIDETGSVAEGTVSGTLTVTDGDPIQNNKILEFTDITGTGKGISSVFMCRIYRDPTDPGDTFEQSVWLKSADVHIEKDTLGSELETTK